MNRELRTYIAQELRASGSDQKPSISGYAATFSTIAEIADRSGQFREVIQPGAFKRSLSEGDDVVALIDHNPSMLLGRRSAGTLSLQEDSTGLKFSVELPDTSVARDAYANLKAGNLKECSFGFIIDSPDSEDWSLMPDGTPLRTLVSVRLFDVSVVCYPAYSGTSAAARNIVAPEVEARLAAFGNESEADATRRVRLHTALLFQRQNASEVSVAHTERLKLRAQNLRS